MRAHLCVFVASFCTVQAGLFARLFGHVPNATHGGGGEGLERGRAMLQRFGFLRRAADPQHVGIMHQLVQKAVRQNVMALAAGSGVPEAWVPRLMDSVESVLYAAFRYDGDDMDVAEGGKRWLRMLSPCVERWCEKCGEYPYQPLATPQRLAVACSLKETRGLLLLKDGQHGDALKSFQDILAFRKWVLPPDHPQSFAAVTCPTPRVPPPSLSAVSTPRLLTRRAGQGARVRLRLARRPRKRWWVPLRLLLVPEGALPRQVRALKEGPSR